MQEKEDAKASSENSQSSKSGNENLNGGRGKVETVTHVNSPPKGKEIVLKDPLGGAENVGNGEERAEVKINSTRLLKSELSCADKKVAYGFLIGTSGKNVEDYRLSEQDNRATLLYEEYRILSCHCKLPITV